MERNTLCLMIVTITLSLGGSAHARSDCPSPYDDDDCAVTISGRQVDVCWYDSTDTEYKCDRFDSSDDYVRAVSDDSDTEMYVWGSARGEEFCCDYSDIVPIRIETGAGGDEIYLWYGEGFAEYHQETSVILAGAGWDTVGGSPYDSCSWPCDDIQVGYGEDTALAYGGDDKLLAPQDDTESNTLYGGSGDDKIWGGEGGDYLYGEDGEDVIRGGDGADRIYGGDDDDWIHGNDTRDYWLDGESGSDTVCGGSDAADLEVHGGTTGTDYDTCAESGSDTLHDCEDPQASCPSAPW